VSVLHAEFTHFIKTKFTRGPYPKSLGSSPYLHMGGVVMLLIHNREVFGSNLGWGIGYPDADFPSFHSVIPGKHRDRRIDVAR
jgi:hypothetical protein